MAKSSIINILSYLILLCFHEVYARSLETSGTLRNILNDGNREKLTIDLSKESDDFDNAEKKWIAEGFRRFIRRSLTDSQPEINSKEFHDKHYVAEVHWSGEKSSSILVLMKDPEQLMSSSKPSHLYISRDYGKTYTNYTSNFTLPNGTIAVINDFFSSKFDNRKYIFVSKFHKQIFVSVNECYTIKRVAVDFHPTEVKFHPRYSYYVLAHEGDMGSGKLYSSTNNGNYWRLKGSNIKKYYWAYARPYDFSSYFYYLRENWYSYAGIVQRSSPWGYYYQTTVAYNVDDFELVNQYMFVTKNSTVQDKKELYISLGRGIFQNTSFPHPHSADNYIIADATENETMVAVRHGSIANLYISDVQAKRFSLSLPGILFCDKEFKTSRCSRFTTHNFIDLHRVEGLSGVYIATNLSSEISKHQYLRSFITFDKGGYWSLVAAPSSKNCSVVSGCSLHLSQEYGRHNPYTRYSPIYSKKSAPGYILATGSVGSSLTTKPSLFFSRDAGLNWKKLFDGNFYFAFVDHGGVLVAVEKYTPTRYLRYSWDEGLNWNYYAFSDTTMRIYGLLTEPGEKTAIFTLFGSYAGAHSWILIQVDVKNVLGRPCQNGTDYKTWEVVDQRNDTQHCLLGRKQTFIRRDPKSRCYNGYDFDRPKSTAPCLCTREDFMCDYGFKEVWTDWFHVECQHDSDFEDYRKNPPSWCTPGAVYNVSSGYRKVPGDFCVGGVSSIYEGQSRICPIKRATDFLIYARRYHIYRYDILTRETVTFSLNGLKNVIALDMDYANNILFYADIAVDKVIMMNLTSGNITTLVSFNASRTHIEALAYDWLSSNLYYLDAGSSVIGIINITKGHKKEVLGSDTLGRPRALAVYPSKGLMYWTDWGTTPKIGRANMDGSDSKVLVTGNLQWPNGLSIDYETDTVYWADAGIDRIESCNLDGGSRRIIRSSSVPHPYALTVYKQYLYWDDWNSRAILRIDKRNGNNRQYVIRYVYNAMDMKAFSPTRQKSGTNGCSGAHTCKFMCLPKYNSGYNCTCPDNLLSKPGPEQCTCPNGETLVDGKCITSKNCNPFQFKCVKDNACIPSHWKCDSDQDCSDGSDEAGCETKTCENNQFACDNGRCILGSWRCDKDNDCGDNSDEKNCNSTSACTSGHFRCPNGRCISASWRCDGDNDCLDNFDEKGCTTSTTASTLTCAPSQFRCNRGYCISKTLKCNGADDCGDNSDENGCSSGCKELKCRNGRCVNKRLHCNSQNDCGDWSDEENCTTNRPPPTKPLVCSGEFAYCADNKQCYERKYRCDNNFDCKDKSDERNCKRTSARPPTKPRCKGFLCGDGQTCIPLGMKCDTVKDCPDGADEKICEPVDDKCLPSPFGFNCSINFDRSCYKSNIVCNGNPDCAHDLSDEDKSICYGNGRVNNLRYQIFDSYAELIWDYPDVKLSQIDGLVATKMDSNLNVTSEDIAIKQFHNFTNLKPCMKYMFAIGVRVKTKKRKQWLYQQTPFISTIGQRVPKPPRKVTVYPHSLFWEEDSGECFKGYTIIRKLHCKNGIDVELPPPLTTSRNQIILDRFLASSLSGEYQCIIRIEYQQGDAIQSLDSAPFKISWNPKKQKQTSGNKKSNTLIWAIPVALVLIALLCGMIVMAYKYRRLQHSFLAFAARGSYTRQGDDFDDDDDDEREMVVGFHQGETAPMINRFSDDEPLVVG